MVRKVRPCIPPPAQPGKNQDPGWVTSLLEVVTWMISLKGRDLKVLHLDPGFAEVWGRSPEDLREDPASLQDRIHPDDRARVAHSYEQLLKGEFPVIQFRIIRPDGEVRRLESHCFPAGVKEDGARRVGGFCLDITRCLRMLEELQQSESRYRTLVEQVPAITYIVGLDEPATHPLSSAPRLKPSWAFPRPFFWRTPSSGKSNSTPRTGSGSWPKWVRASPRAAPRTWNTAC